MNKRNCNECKNKECEYREFVLFLKYMNEKEDSKFEIIACPDKENLSYTCDLELMDVLRQEKIYIEIKEVKYGFVNKKKLDIAEENAQIICRDLIYKVISETNEEKALELDDFIIQIPRCHISGEAEKECFCNKLSEFININTFKGDEYKFLFKRKRGDIEIFFCRKSDEMREKFGEELLFAFDTRDNNTIDAIFKRLTNIDNLKNLIMQNLKNTSEKKFPKEDSRKILLNILTIPIGEELFFNLNMKYIIAELMHESYVSVSAANESYLLYYCDDYNEVIDKNSKLSDSKEEVLFVIPLISNWMKEIQVYPNSDA